MSSRTVTMAGTRITKCKGESSPNIHRGRLSIPAGASHPDRLNEWFVSQLRLGRRDERSYVAWLTTPPRRKIGRQTALTDSTQRTGFLERRIPIDHRDLRGRLRSRGSHRRSVPGLARGVRAPPAPLRLEMRGSGQALDLRARTDPC